jgi:hypothetical protein
MRDAFERLGIDEGLESAEDFERQLERDFGWKLSERIARRARREAYNPTIVTASQGADFVRERPEAAQPTRIAFAFKVEKLTYGSLEMILGILNFDSLLEIVGRNLELLKVVVGYYLPTAFADTFNMAESVVKNNFDFLVTIPPALYAVAAATQTSKGAENGTDEKGRGARVLSAVTKDSALLLPVIAIVFLWYFARDDARHDHELVGQLLQQDREHTSKLLQKLAEQQTEVMKVLKDTAVANQSESRLTIPISKFTIAMDTTKQGSKP